MKPRKLAVALAILIIQPMSLNAGMRYVKCSSTHKTTRIVTNVSATGSRMGCGKSVRFSSCSLEKLVDATAVVEGAKPTDRTGDQGRAVGAWQLHKCAVDHVNQRFKVFYSWPEDALDIYRAREIVKLYLRICGYAKYDLEEVARRYNGGNKRWRSPAAGRYWQKVRKQLY